MSRSYNRERISDEELEKEHKVAYYLSRFEHDNLYPHYNQTVAFQEISKILGVKVNTLKNKRDTFDPFCNKLKTRGKKRAGWRQKEELSYDMQKVYDYYLNMSEEDIENEIREILKQKQSSARVSKNEASKEHSNTQVDSLGPIDKGCTTSPNRRVRREKLTDEELEREHKVAYYLSRFEHEKIYPNCNQTQAFKKASKALGVKLTTLRHKRDMYDPFCNDIKNRGKKRSGWWQKGELSCEMQRVFDYFLNMSEDDIEKEVREILGEYKEVKKVSWFKRLFG